MHSFASCQKLLAVFIVLCRSLPQWANLSESTQLSCRWSWYLSGLVTCRTSTLLFSIPTASHSPVGQYPREKICKATKHTPQTVTAAIVYTKYHPLYSSALGVCEHRARLRGRPLVGKCPLYASQQHPKHLRLGRTNLSKQMAVSLSKTVLNMQQLPAAGLWKRKRGG